MLWQRGSRCRLVIADLGSIPGLLIRVTAKFPGSFHGFFLNSLSRFCYLSLFCLFLFPSPVYSSLSFTFILRNTHSSKNFLTLRFIFLNSFLFLFQSCIVFNLFLKVKYSRHSITASCHIAHDYNQNQLFFNFVQTLMKAQTQKLHAHEEKSMPMLTHKCLHDFVHT